MSLGNREGEACVETEPEELPEKVNGSVLRVTGDCWRISASFCHSAGGRFFSCRKKRVYDVFTKLCLSKVNLLPAENKQVIYRS